MSLLVPKFQVIHKSLRLSRVVLGLTICACFIIASLLGGYGTPSASGSDETGTGKSFGSSVKDGWDKFTGTILPTKTPSEKEPVDDPISLRTKAKPGPEVYTAVARLYEQSGKTAEAERQYQMALKEEPNDLSALLGYAHLKENLGKPEEAVKLYQQAAKAQPNEAAVFNNLGLCYAHRGMPDEAITALGRAVQLQPKNVLYRNNLATILVEKGQIEQAFSHLRAVHGDAVAYYNLGYLLNRKGRKQEAIHHFTMALQRNPSLTQARMWLAWLQNGALPPATQPTAQPSPAHDRADSLRVACDPPMPSPAATNTRPEWRPAVGNQPPPLLPPAKRPDSAAILSAAATSPPVATTPASWPAGATAASAPSTGRESAPRGIVSQPSPAPRSSEGNQADVRRDTPGGLPPMPPDLSSPKRLPPIASTAVTADAPPLKGQSAEGGGVNAAPAAKPILKSAIRVLPREPQ